MVILLMSPLGAFAVLPSTATTQDVCIGSQPYEVTAVGTDTYLWTITGGTSGTDWTFTGSSTAESTTIDWKTPGTYTLTLRESNTSSCYTYNTITVNVYPTPSNYTVTGGGSYCAGGAGFPVGLSGSQTG